MANLSLSHRRKANGKKHLPAMPWREVPALMARLRANPDNIARAMELAILCASRPSEVLNARWSEFDLDAATWAIPGKRMKNSKEHRAPLSLGAVELLANLPRVGDEYLFGGRGDGPPSAHMLRFLLRRMGCRVVPHGFRTSFRTWAEEATRYPRHVVEMALAQQIATAVERAYRRGDLLDQRRRLMQDWSDFVASV